MHGYWNDNWWWMAIMMIAFWGGIIWIAVTVIRHTGHTPRLQAPEQAPIAPPPRTPQEMLAERLARGEIESDDFRQRLDALEHRPSVQP